MAKTNTPWTEKKVLLTLFGAIFLIKVCLFFWGKICFDFSLNPEQTWLSIWDRWDAYWYQIIAANGYLINGISPEMQAFASHFPPFYPFLIRLFASLLFLSTREAGILISLSLCFVNSYLLYSLVTKDFQNRQMAVLSVLFFNFYPVAYFTNTIYTESLYTFLTLFSFYLIRKENYVIPGILGACAIMTRYIGVNILSAYLFIIWQNRHKFTYKYLYLLVLPPLGLVIELLINIYYFGSPFFVVNEHKSNPASIQTPSFPPIPLKEAIGSLPALFENLLSGFKDDYFMMTLGWSSIFTIFALTVVLIGFYKKLPRDYSIYALSYILFFSSFTWTISAPRFTLPLFPIFITLAMIKNRFILGLIMATFFILQLHFVRIFVNASWAF
jgi:Gpi18-like mannosyltransferase